MMTLTERIKDTELFYESMSRLLQHLFKSAVIRRSASINARMPSGCAKNASLISYLLSVTLLDGAWHGSVSGARALHAYIFAWWKYPHGPATSARHAGRRRD